MTQAEYQEAINEYGLVASGTACAKYLLNLHLQDLWLSTRSNPITGKWLKQVLISC